MKKVYLQKVWLSRHGGGKAFLKIRWKTKDFQLVLFVILYSAILQIDCSGRSDFCSSMF